MGRWNQLPSYQIQVSGSNITLTLNNASQNGVISEFGGPAFASKNKVCTTENTATSTPQIQIPPTDITLGASSTILVIATAIVFSRKLFHKSKHIWRSVVRRPRTILIYYELLPRMVGDILQLDHYCSRRSALDERMISNNPIVKANAIPESSNSGMGTRMIGPVIVDVYVEVAAYSAVHV